MNETRTILVEDDPALLDRLYNLMRGAGISFNVGTEEGLIPALGGLQKIREDFESREREFIRKALLQSNRNLRGAARNLGVSHTTLHAKVKKYGLNGAQETV